MDCLGGLGEQNGDLSPYCRQLLTVEGPTAHTISMATKHDHTHSVLPEEEGEGTAWLLAALGPSLLNDSGMECGKVTFVVGSTATRQDQSIYWTSRTNTACVCPQTALPHPQMEQSYQR